jgi:hypothetical protein
VELEQVFDHYAKHHIKILFVDFNAKLWKKVIFKPTTGNDSLHKISKDNGVRIINFATPKIRVVKSTMFQRRKIHKHTWTSPDWETYNKMNINIHRCELVLEYTRCTNFRGADCDIDHYLVVAKVRAVWQ